MAPQVHRLTTGTGYGDRDPAFSPTGTKIAFTRDKKNTRRNGIYVMNANGSHLHRLARNAADPAYSATSGKIAFERGAAEIGPLYVMNADGSHQHPLARFGGTPDFSPDGKEIAFVRLDNVTAVPYIVVINADGSRQSTGSPGAPTLCSLRTARRSPSRVGTTAVSTS